MNTIFNSKDKTVARECGQQAGREANYLRSIGATDAQVKLFIERSIGNTPEMYRQTWLTAARKSFANPGEKFNHPIYNLRKQRLTQTLAYWNR